VAKVVLAEASMKRRVQLAQALGPLGLRVHGDPHWKRLVPSVQVADVIDYHTELPALFAASDINANVTAEQMPTAVNQRVWDVPACGGFLLTDAQKDVLDHFEPGREVAVYQSPEEAADKARYYLSKPAERRAIADAGRARVDAAHRYTHRLETVYDTMRARFA
jgi:spore maturation protein CgeB